MRASATLLAKSIRLLSFDWVRPKDPPLSYGLASICAQLSKAGVEHCSASIAANGEQQRTTAPAEAQGPRGSSVSGGHSSQGFNAEAVGQAASILLEGSTQETVAGIGAFIWCVLAGTWLARQRGACQLGGMHVSCVLPQ